MSNIVKWGLLGAGLIAIIALVGSLGLTDGLNQLGGLFNQFVSLSGVYLQKGRGLINNFLTPFGRTLLSGLIGYIFFKWVYIMGAKILATIYHFIFRG